MANTAMERRYGLLSKQMERQETQRTEQEKEALRRRFAAMGGLGSGASIKAESLAGEAGARRLSQARMGLESEKLREEQQQEELGKQRQFQTSERQAQQSWAAQQAHLGREFSSSERLGSQQFAAQQAHLGREFSSSEREAQQYWAAQQALLGREFTAEEARKMREMQQSQFDAANKLAFDEFEFNKLVTQRNEQRADIEANKSEKSMLEEIFGEISLNPGNLFV